MPHSKHQMVFPFLTDDPAYIRDLREEQIIEEAKADLEPVLHSQMIDILHGLAKTEFKEYLEMLVADAVENVMKDVRGELHNIDRYVQALFHGHKRHEEQQSDPADWWKHGGESDEDEELQF